MTYTIIMPVLRESQSATRQQIVMSQTSEQEWLEKAAIAQSQVRETVQQETAGITVRLATLTCPCGRKRAMVKMYQCLYCKIWLCDPCAEAHFGKTVEQYRAEHPIGT